MSNEIETRDELTEKVRTLVAQHDADTYRQSVGAEFSNYPDASKTATEIIALVRAAAVDPEPGLDELLNSVHPGCYIDGMKHFDSEWRVWLMWPGLMAEPVRGTGPTRIAAIADAVRQAKENGDELA